MKRERLYDNGETVTVGDKVVITEGKHKGQQAEVIEAGGCVYVKLTSNDLEVEIHEAWLIKENTVVKFYSSVASSGAKRKVFGYKGSLAVFDRGGCLQVVPYKDGYLRARGDRRYH